MALSLHTRSATDAGHARRRSKRRLPRSLAAGVCLVLSACSGGGGAGLDVEDWRSPYLEAVEDSIDSKSPTEDVGDWLRCYGLVVTSIWPQESLERVEADEWGSGWNTRYIGSSVMGVDSRTSDRLVNTALDACAQSRDDAVEALAAARTVDSPGTSAPAETAEAPPEATVPPDDPGVISTAQFSEICADGDYIRSLVDPFFSGDVWITPSVIGDRSCSYALVLDVDLHLFGHVCGNRIQGAYSDLIVEFLPSTNQVEEVRLLDELLSDDPVGFEVLSFDQVKRDEAAGQTTIRESGNFVVTTEFEYLGPPGEEIILSAKVVEFEDQGLYVRALGRRSYEPDGIEALVSFFDVQGFLERARTMPGVGSTQEMGFDLMPEAWLSE